MVKKTEPYMSELYYYIGEDDEYHTCGKQYRVVAVDYHQDKRLGKVIYITDNEYPDTKDIDYCVIYTVDIFHKFFRRY